MVEEKNNSEPLSLNDLLLYCKKKNWSQNDQDMRHPPNTYKAFKRFGIYAPRTKSANETAIRRIKGMLKNGNVRGGGFGMRGRGGSPRNFRGRGAHAYRGFSWRGRRGGYDRYRGTPFHMTPMPHFPIFSPFRTESMFDQRGAFSPFIGMPHYDYPTPSSPRYSFRGRMPRGGRGRTPRFRLRARGRGGAPSNRGNMAMTRSLNPEQLHNYLNRLQGQNESFSSALLENGVDGRDFIAASPSWLKKKCGIEMDQKRLTQVRYHLVKKVQMDSAKDQMWHPSATPHSPNFVPLSSYRLVSTYDKTRRSIMALSDFDLRTRAFSVNQHVADLMYKANLTGKDLVRMPDDKFKRSFGSDKTTFMDSLQKVTPPTFRDLDDRFAHLEDNLKVMERRVVDMYKEKGKTPPKLGPSMLVRFSVARNILSRTFRTLTRVERFTMRKINGTSNPNTVKMKRKQSSVAKAVNEETNDPKHHKITNIPLGKIIKGEEKEMTTTPKQHRTPIPQTLRPPVEQLRTMNMSEPHRPRSARPNNKSPKGNGIHPSGNNMTKKKRSLPGHLPVRINFRFTSSLTKVGDLDCHSIELDYKSSSGSMLVDDAISLCKEDIGDDDMQIKQIRVGSKILGKSEKLRWKRINTGEKIELVDVANSVFYEVDLLFVIRP